MSDKEASKKGMRVYKYKSADGTEFFSFVKYGRTITPSMTLRLESRVGTHLENFLQELRSEGRSQQKK
jgi:hypothetical protein